jgi:hypothetical protein
MGVEETQRSINKSGGTYVALECSLFVIARTLAKEICHNFMCNKEKQRRPHGHKRDQAPA